MRKCLFLLVLFYAFILAQENPMERFFSQEDTFNLGDLGAQGLPLEKKELETFNIQKGMTGIRITSVVEGGPAEKAGLQKGMVMIGAGSALFSKKIDPLHLLLMAIESSASKKNAPPLVVIVTDGTKPQKFKVEIPYTGGHSSSCPKKCDRCTQVIQSGLEFLKSQQEGNGGLPSKMMNMQSRVVITSLAGLAFLGTGSTLDEGEYAPQIQGCLKFIQENVLETERNPFSNAGEGTSQIQNNPGRRDNWNQENWALSYAPLFLAELYKRSAKPEIFALMKQIADRLLQNQETSGGWAHGPGGPNALNYVELEVMSNWALASLGMMKELGVEMDEEKINKGIQYVIACGTADGGIAYSTRQGQIGYGEVGRTGGATFAFQMLKLDRHPYYKPLTKYLKRYMEKTSTGHVSPVMHYFAVGIASYNFSPAYWKQYIELFRNEFMLYRGIDGSFSAVPTEESKSLKSNSDRGLGPNWATASYLVLLQIPTGHYQLLVRK